MIGKVEIDNSRYEKLLLSEWRRDVSPRNRIVGTVILLAQ